MCQRCNSAGDRWHNHPEEQLAASMLAAGRTRKHGLWQHPLYPTWQQMMYRTRNPKHPRFQDYGGRGITVCAQWHDPAVFIAWIEQNLGPRPDGCTLDRADNNGNYEPGNMRWATRKVQSGNRRRVRTVGSAKPQATLTEEIVRECRIRAAAGEGQRELAAEYGVSKPTMHKAITGKTWQHVT